MSTPRLGNSRTPDNVEVLRAAMNAMAAGLSVALPGTIVLYNAATQTADVQPLLNRAVIGQSGDEAEEILPIIPSVPVVFPRGGGYFLTLPLAPGDNVLLVFNDRSIDTFMVSTGSVPMPQVDLRQHHLSDAVAIPGFYPTPKVLKALTTPDMVLGGENQAQLRMRGATAEFTTAGAPASVGGFVALATLVLAELAAMKTAFDSHTHLYNPGPGTPTTTAVPVPLFPTPSSPASTNLKAD